jgi:hypothetical protein
MESAGGGHRKNAAGLDALIVGVSRDRHQGWHHLSLLARPKAAGVGGNGAIRQEVVREGPSDSIEQWPA